MNWRRAFLIAVLSTVGYICLLEEMLSHYLDAAMHASLLALLSGVPLVLLSSPGMFVADKFHIGTWPTHFGLSPLPNDGHVAIFTTGAMLFLVVWLAVVTVAFAKRVKRKGTAKSDAS